MGNKKSKTKAKAKPKVQVASAAQDAPQQTKQLKQTKQQTAAKKQAAQQMSPAKKRTAIIIGAVVAVVAVVAIAAFVFLGVGKSNLLTAKGYDTSNLKVYSEAQSSDGGRTVSYKGKTYALNEKVVPICVIGRDKELHKPDEGTNGQSDAIMVVAVNTENNDIKAIAIPRDSMVKSLPKFKKVYQNTSYKTDKMQLCLTYACGDNDKQSSGYVESAVSDLLFGIPMNWYYALDTSAIGDLADMVGGVTLEALYDVPYASYADKKPMNKGDMLTLTGTDALRYVQARDTSRYQTALERLERQRQFVKLLAQKLLEQAKGNPNVIVDLMNKLSASSTTDLGTAEFGYLASIAAQTNIDSLDITRLQGEAIHNSDNPWEQFFVDEEQTYQIVLDTFYKEN